MGVACLLNALRCGRTHCYVTGPFFLILAGVALLYRIGILPLGARGWSTFPILVRASEPYLCKQDRPGKLPRSLKSRASRRSSRPASFVLAGPSAAPPYSLIATPLKAAAATELEVAAGVRSPYESMENTATRASPLAL